MSFSPSNHNFNSKSEDYQRKVVQCLIEDHDWAARMFDIIDESYFTEKYMALLVNVYFSYYKKYKVFPTLNTFVTLVKDSITNSNEAGNKILLKHIVNFLKSVKSEPLGSDSIIIKDNAYSFCKKNALAKIITEMARNLDNENFNAENIVREMTSAIHIGEKNEIGLLYKEEFDKRKQILERSVIPTGTILDEKETLNGGIEPGQALVIMAPTGVGKSMVMVALASNMLRRGLNVVYYTLELSENKIGVRFDANFSEIVQQDVYLEENESHVKTSIDNLCKGELVVKEFNAYELTVERIRQHLKMLEAEGIKPDAIFIDYVDLMKQLTESQGDNIVALRSLGKEFGCPVITAVQTNRSGSTKDVLTKEDISEDFKKVMHCDILLGFTAEGVLSVIKNRNGKSGHFYLSQYDWGTVVLQIMQEADEDLMVLKTARPGSAKEGKSIEKNLKNYFLDKSKKNKDLEK